MRQAGQRLGKDPKFVKGFAECMGIELEPASTSLFMTEADFERLRERVEGRKPCAHAAATQ